PDAHDAAFWVARYNAFLVAAGLIALYILLRKSMEARALRLFLLLAATTAMIPHESLAFGAETFNAVLVAVGLAACVTADAEPSKTSRASRAVLGCVALGLGAANMPATLVGLGLASLALVIGERRLRFLLAPLLAVILAFGENWIRKGSPFSTGYEHDAGFPT